MTYIKTDSFKLNTFLENQEKIWTKYDSLENGLSLKSSEKNFINNFDRYILHTLEEVYEAYEETNKLEINDEEFINELIDIVMYSGTALSIINKNLKEYGEDIQVGNIDLKNTEEHPYSQNLDDLSIFILCEYMSIRRMFNKRKWHKYSEEMNDDKKVTCLYMIKAKLENIIKYTLSYINNSNNGFNSPLDVNSLISRKQSFILSLSEINK